MRLPLSAVCCILFTSALAVFTDEAWNIDYHFSLLGEPRQETTSFHQPNPNSRASLIYTLSRRAILGAVNPRDGALVWRQQLSHNATFADNGSLRAGQDQDVVISGSGNQAAAWSAADGRLVWEINAAGPVEDVEILELTDSVTTPDVKDALVLSGGDEPIVQRVDGASGSVKWQYKLDGGDTPYQVSASDTEVYAIQLHKTMLGYIKIKVVSLDSVDGHKIDEFSISSDSELASADTILSVGANSASPIIAWTDAAHSVLKVNILGTKAISSFNVEKHGDQAVQRIHIHAPFHTNSRSHFLAHFTTATSHWAEVYHVDLKKNKIEKAYSLPKVAGKGAFATSTSDANVYFTRITQDEITTVSSASHGVLGRWPVNGFKVAAGIDEVVEPVHAISELSVKGDAVSAIRTAVLLSTGDWILLREGSSVWARPEMLADTLTATFAAPSTLKGFADELEREAHSNPIQAYVYRLGRHIQDLQRLPAILSTLPQRMLNAIIGTSADSGDYFGFHTVIACATRGGRLVAIDAGDPSSVLWNRRIESHRLENDWEPILSTIKSTDALVLTSSEGKEHEFFNASTGETLTELPIPTEPTYASVLPGVEYSWHNGQLAARKSDQPSTEMWHFTPADGERVVSLVPRPINDPVASIGKVLGDRRVLYKYLNPNLALLVTANDLAQTASFYVLDTISGGILYSNTHSRVNLHAPVSATMSENWFVYSFTAEASESSPKGHMLVAGEMFDSLIPDDRGPLSAASNFSSVQSGAEPFTLVLTYQVPEAVSKMTVTQTQQGITSRQLIAVLAESQAIVGIPYGILDPRRPVNRDPTKTEQAEGLMRYSSNLEFDPKWYLNHQREVIGVENVLTSPALIESTSIVFAYGLDIFGTRLSPSFSFDILGKDFNKFQMLATVAALAMATFVVAPLVTRKQVDTRWKFTA